MPGISYKASNGGAQATDGFHALRSGNYHFTLPASGSSVSTLGTGTLRLTPFIVPAAVSLTRIGAEVTVAGDVGSKVRLGVYADDGTGYPGALVIDAGTIAGDSVAVQEITINQALSAGLYWVGSATQIVTTTQPTIRIPANVPYESGSPTIPASAGAFFGYAQASVTGALPATFTATVAASGSAARTFVKIA